LHIKQQAAERMTLERNKIKCKNLDKLGNPITGLIFSGIYFLN
jgi:hypothetical protein